MIAFIEGKMERQFVNTNFKHVRVVPVSNGISWATPQLCRQIVVAYKVLDLPDEVVVWVDREGRQESAEEMCNALRNELTAAGAEDDRVHILLNDRVAENVILADEQVIQQEFGQQDYAYTYEGANGKPALKNLYSATGTHYKETKHGVALLKRIRLSRSAQTSAAVQSFLATFNRECWWINA